MENIFGKLTKWFILIMCAAVLQHCVSTRQEENLKVALHLERENLAQSSILILNFKEPEYAKGMGAEVASLFHLQMLEAKKFQVISLNTHSLWSLIGDNEEENLMQALQETRERSFDYILVGELKEFYYGGLHPTRVFMKVRIIEVKSKTTIFLASHGIEMQGKDPNYPMQTQLARKSTAPLVLVEKLIRQIIKKI